MRSLKEQASGTSNCRSSMPSGGEPAWPDSTKWRPFRWLSIRLHLFVVYAPRLRPAPSATAAHLSASQPATK